MVGAAEARILRRIVLFFAQMGRGDKRRRAAPSAELLRAALREPPRRAPRSETRALARELARRFATRAGASRASPPAPAPAPSPLVELADLPWVRALVFLDGAAIARLRFVARALAERLRAEPALARWCAASRRARLVAGYTRGDLPVGALLLAKADDEGWHESAALAAGALDAAKACDGDDRDDGDDDDGSDDDEDDDGDGGDGGGDDDELRRWLVRRDPMEVAANRAAEAISARLARDAARVRAWSFERLHLCERPPRFPRIHFAFASDEIGREAAPLLAHVAALLQRHPRLRVRVEGFAQTTAPPALGHAVAQARATSVRAALLRDHLPRDASPWREEIARDDGVHASGGYDETGGHDDMLENYRPRVVGRALQAVGRWGADPLAARNENFEAEADADAYGAIDADDPQRRFRRVDFTLLGLEGETESDEDA